MKFAVAAVAVALCGRANAAGCMWEINYVSLAKETDTATAGAYQAFLFDGADYNKVLAILSSEGVTHKQLADLAFQTGVGEVSTTANYPNTLNFSSGIPSTDAGTLPDTAFAVIIDANESTFSTSAKNYMIAKSYFGGGKEIIARDDTTYSKYSWSAYFWRSQENNTWHEIGTIPEPTGGVLILVGVAALALRRRQRRK